MHKKQTNFGAILLLNDIKGCVYEEEKNKYQCYASKN